MTPTAPSLCARSDWKEKQNMARAMFRLLGLRIMVRISAPVWYGWYGAPSVYRYNEYISETTLYDVAKSEIVWSGTIRTTDPNDVPTGIKNYVAAVMRDLNEKDLLAKFSQGFGGL